MNRKSPVNTMNLSMFQDRHTTGLLNRVRKDVDLLRADIGNLLADTTRRALPNTAHEIADLAKHQLAAGSAYAASRLRNLKATSPPPTASWVGGAALLGLAALGVYAYLCRSSACRQAAANGADESDFDAGGA